MTLIMRHKPSPALVISLIALVAALGGTSYAAITLPKNSVGTRQLKNNAVNSSKVRNGSLVKADFKAGQLPREHRGRRERPARRARMASMPPTTLSTLIATARPSPTMLMAAIASAARPVQRPLAEESS